MNLNSANPKYEIFKIVGMNLDGNEFEESVLKTIENLGYTIVRPSGSDDVLCCMTSEEMERHYCN